MTARESAALLLAAALAAGCATSPLQISGEDLQGPPQAPHRRARTPALPLVVIEPVTDAREPDSAGHLAGQVVRMESATAWLDAELTAIDSPAFDVANAEGASLAPGPALRVRPRLLKAYAQPVASSQSVNVVLEATYIALDGTVTVRLHRGRHVGAVVLSATAETAGAFRTAGAACARESARSSNGWSRCDDDPGCGSELAPLPVSPPHRTAPHPGSRPAPCSGDTAGPASRGPDFAKLPSVR